MEQLITIIQFIFISDTNVIKPSEMKIKLNLQKECYNLKNDNQIRFHAKCPSRKIYYGEIITVFYNNIELCTFHFLIYINKKNIIIFDMDETNHPSFELFFYAKETQYNPSKIRYKDVEYAQFMNYGNKFRSRIFFANINPAELEYINSPALKKYNYDFNYDTYQAIFRMINRNEFEVTLTDMACYINDFEDKQYERLTSVQFSELKDLLLEFSEKYYELFYNDDNTVKERKEIHKQLINLSDNIVSNVHYYFIESPNLNEYTYYEENELLYMFQIDLYLNEFIKLNEENKTPDIDEFESFKKIIIRNNEMQESLYQKLINDISLNINQKIKIMKTITLFFKNTLFSGKPIFGVNYLNINVISNNSPYAKSLKLLKDIISGLTEESRLFEAFLYFNSDIIENLLTKNTQPNYIYKDIFGEKVEINQSKYITEYGMSLMTVEEIKTHLRDLLPKVIIQIDTNINIRALLEKETKMMVINEFKMFNNFCNINESTLFKTQPDCYIIPITIEILHEMFGNAKLRYSEDNEKYNYSPLVIRDSKNNFKPQKLIKRIKLFDNTEKYINKGETGRVLEHYISENRDVIQTLKQMTFNKEIINAKYWTGSNFDSLHKAISIDGKNINVSLGYDILSDNYYYEDNYECMFNGL